MGSTELRLILLGVGIILIIGIYAWERGKRRRHSARRPLAAFTARGGRFARRVAGRPGRRGEEAAAEIARTRREPVLGGGEPAGAAADALEPTLGQDPARRDDPDVAAAPAGPEPPLPGVLVVNVSARVGQQFTGDAVMSAARDVGLIPGDMEILHRFDEATGEILFSMANMVKPGTFPFRSMSDFATPGLALFAQLPAARPPLEIYDTLLLTGERLAALLDGRLQDEHRRPLTTESVTRMRERIAAAGTS
jgi:cell division protein ZipA